MSGLDKTGRIDLERALETVGGEHGQGELYHDLIGPAIYRLEPSPMTATACVRCRHLGLIPSIPRKQFLTWTCPGCGAHYRLAPPLEVLRAGVA